jgi:hypothetical protein
MRIDCPSALAAMGNLLAPNRTTMTPTMIRM